ncbi:MAG: GNAT family N-acetyltransferase [Synergistaceae bacterium]|nr:GNAT family N-acetyltransferase [Synergistaceae bacterium]
MRSKLLMWNELKFFIESLKSLSVSQSLTLGRDECFCVSTNCSWESWVCYPDSINNAQEIRNAVDFFKARDISFMWPLYDDNDSKLLEQSGLVYAGKLEAMTLEPDKAVTNKANPDVIIKPVTNHELAGQWAETAWSAFSSFGEENEETSANYYAMFDAFLSHENFSLYLAYLDDKPAGTFIITHEKALTGVYYFATLHEFRRRGVAASMMREICRLSDGKTIALQATPMGFNFYKGFGFEDLFAIKVYSTEPDIF